MSATRAASILAFILLLPLAACQRESVQPETVQSMVAAAYESPEGWAELNREAIRLFTEGQKAESTAMLETFVERHPDFADGHFALAANHEFIALDMKDDPEQAAERERNLKAAVLHYERFRELKSDPDDRAQGTNLLVQLYGPDGLNQMDAAVANARRYTLERPSSSGGHGQLARMLRSQGSHEEATEVLLEALERFPRAERESELTAELVAHVEETPQLSRPTAERLLAEAIADADRQMADPATRGGGMLAKALVLRASARRVEQDPDRRKELEAESERLRKEGLALLMGT